MAEQIKIEWGKKKYTACWGTVKYKADPELVAKEIESIGESVTPQDIVDYAAVNVESELHSIMQFDDSIAANKYRLQQARSILNNLKITFVERKSDKPQATNINYFSSTEHKYANYKKTEIIFKQVDEYQKMLKKALDELKWFKDKYSRFSELNGVFDAIDEVLGQ